MLCILQDEEGELQLQRQSLLCRKMVSAFDLSHSGQMCGAGTMDGMPPADIHDKEEWSMCCVNYSTHPINAEA